MFSQRIQWTPLLLVISIYECENTHSVALGLTVYLHKKYVVSIAAMTATSTHRITAISFLAFRLPNVTTVGSNINF